MTLERGGNELWIGWLYCAGAREDDVLIRRKGNEEAGDRSAHKKQRFFGRSKSQQSNEACGQGRRLQ